jgi:hypothetical protein
VECFKEVDGFPGYRVSNYGYVQSSKRLGIWRTLVPSVKRNGYYQVSLCRNGKVYYKSIAHLVLEAFIGPRPNGMEALHGSGNDKSNNSAANLRWGTHAENLEDRNRDGRTAKGESGGMAKLTAVKVLEIRKAYETGLMDLASLSVMYGHNVGHIAKIIRRELWGHI